MGIALIFSGQGSQYAGMGKELVENFPKLKKIYEQGSEILGFDLQKTVNEGSEAELAKTIVSQPAIYAMSLIALGSLKEVVKNFEFRAAAGHSLGEYAAMTAAGILDIENGFKAIKIRSAAMSKANKTGTGGMVAVICAETALIEDVCAEICGGGDYVTPVNYNSLQQTVIAGTEAGLEKAVRSLTEKGVKRTVRLNVSAAFHSELMKEASEEFKENTASIKFNKPSKDFYCNVYGKKLEIADDEPSEFMINYLTKHICSPVRFTDELIAMQNGGIGAFIELGPGKTLTGLVKKTLDGVKTANIEDLKSLEAVKELLCRNK